MKITPKILSIPPYLSTTWKNISSLVVKPDGDFLKLVVILQNRVQVEIPSLNKEIVDQVFEAHAKYAELEGGPLFPLDGAYHLDLPFKSAETGPELLSSSMHHNPDQKDLPPLPPDILKKIGTIVKAFGLEDFSLIPQSEENCNCMYCQVVRSIRGEEKEPHEELISEEDLKFKTWDIEQAGEKLYTVINPLDQNERYNVFLGEPLGCTCGQKNCEHIRAVLSS